MSYFDHYPGRPDPSPERNGWRNLEKIIAELRAQADVMGENKAFYEKELRRMVARLDIYVHVPERDVFMPGGMEGTADLFLPANEQRESLLAVDYEDRKGQELIWRVVLGSEDGPCVFWECGLSSDELHGSDVRLEQSTLTGDLASPAMVRSYLLHELNYPSETLSLLTPVRLAVINNKPGATLSIHHREEESHLPVLSLERLDEWFYQPE